MQGINVVSCWLEQQIKTPTKPVEITDKRSWGTLHQNRGYLIIRRVPVTVPRQIDQYAFITNYNLHHSLQIF